MTVKEHLEAFNKVEGNENKLYYESYILKFAKEFAKAHVKEALLKAFSKAEISGKWGSDDVLLDNIQTRDNDGSWMDLRVDRKSILTSYPLENII